MSEDSELFELCKEVYKRFPDWNTGQWIDYHEGKFTIYTVSDNRYGDYVCPLLNSDYLLEKLPQYIRHEKHDCRLEVSPTGYASKSLTLWAACYVNDSGTHIPYMDTADTPLKALLKLAIALDDAGELIKERDDE